MAIKIFSSKHSNALENAVNMFEQENNVFATQTHVTALPGEGSCDVLYSAVVFFRK